MSFVGARISSIIILSRAKELRLSVLDLSELKEWRLRVTTKPSAAGNNKWRAGEHNIKQKARNPLLHATSREPSFTYWTESMSNKWRAERDRKTCSWTRIRYCRKLFRDGNERPVFFALRYRWKEDKSEERLPQVLLSFLYEELLCIMNMDVTKSVWMVKWGRLEECKYKKPQEDS